MKDRKAFTLIELLVVIAIIGMLLAIIIPALRMAKVQAQKVVCASHERAVGVAVHAYLEDNDSMFHHPANWGLWEDPETGEEYAYDDERAYWGVCYSRYTDGKKVFSCPSMQYPDMWYLPWEPFAGRSRDELFPLFRYCSMGLNSYTSLVKSASDPRPNRYKKLSEFKTPYQVIFAQDHVEQLLDGISADMLCAAPGSNLNLPQWRNYTKQYPHLYPNSVAECFRHGRRSYLTGKGVCNTLWMDGHVSTIAQTDGLDVPVRWYDALREHSN